MQILVHMYPERPLSAVRCRQRSFWVAGPDRAEKEEFACIDSM